MSISRLHWQPRTIKIVLSLTFIAVIVLSAFLVARISVHAASASVASGSKIHRYGPFKVTNDQDTGTCGPVWALDAFNRSFSVNSSTPTEFDEFFTNGTFVTNAGPSEGACASGINNGNTVGAGVKGKLSGEYIDAVVTLGTFNPNAKCTPTTCNTTAGFVAVVYGPTAVYTVNSYDFDYSTLENGAATQDSSDLGGYYGDITGPAVTAPFSKNHNTRVHSL
jgi:hypothetical protein